MESQLQHPRAHDEYHPNAGLSTVAEGEHGHHHGGGDEHHHDHGPKAVIKKVKAKAKKIKETLTKHGHGHDQHYEGHGHDHDDEEDEDEEMVEDPEVHGAPMYESAAIRSGIGGLQSGVNLEKPTSTAEDRYYASHITDPATRPFGAWREENSGQAPSAIPWTNSGQENMSRPPAAAANTPSATPWMSSGQDIAAHVPPPYATPGTHTHDTASAHVPLSFTTHGTHAPATGTTQAHVPPPPYAATHGTNASGFTHDSPSVGRREQPTVRLGPSIPSPLDEDPQAPSDKQKPSNYQSKVSGPTGSGEEAGITSLLHSMDKMKVHDEENRHHRKQEVAPGYTGSHDQLSPEIDAPLKSYDPTNPEDMPRDTFTKPDSSYTGKISSAASAISDKAVAAKNVVASKLGYSGEATTDQSSNTSGASSITDKVVASKNAVASKLGYGGETTSDQSLNTSSGSSTAVKAAAAKDVMASKLGYGGQTTTDQPSNTSTGSSITDKAVAAKNAVASKLGYGGETTTDQWSNTSPTDQSSNTSRVSDYGHKIASSVTGTLAPVYGKVAGVGSTVISKVSGGGGSGGSGVKSTARQEKGTDKGVSVKEYLVEKLRPGEEDKALSEVITHSLYKEDALGGKKEDKDQQKQEEKPMGTVTQSVEVTRRLGGFDEPVKKDGDGASADAGAAGQAVVDRVKGWFGMGSPNSPPSSGTLLAGKKEEGTRE